MVSTDCIFSYDYGYWMAEWGNAKIDEYWVSDDRIYSRDQDFDSLVEDFMDNNYEDYEDITDDELEKLAEEKVNNYEWEKAIIVYINEL